MRLKWRVSPEPTGRYRSFEQRGWPMAYYPDGTYAGCLTCPDPYEPWNMREGKHAPITITIARHHPKSEWGQLGAWTVVRLKATQPNLPAAKKALEDFLGRMTEYHPKGDG